MTVNDLVSRAVAAVTRRWLLRGMLLVNWAWEAAGPVTPAPSSRRARAAPCAAGSAGPPDPVAAGVGAPPAAAVGPEEQPLAAVRLARVQHAPVRAAHHLDGVAGDQRQGVPQRAGTGRRPVLPPAGRPLQHRGAGGQPGRRVDPADGGRVRVGAVGRRGEQRPDRRPQVGQGGHAVRVDPGGRARAEVPAGQPGGRAARPGQRAVITARCGVHQGKCDRLGLARDRLRHGRGALRSCPTRIAHSDSRRRT